MLFFQRRDLEALRLAAIRPWNRKERDVLRAVARGEHALGELKSHPEITGEELCKALPSGDLRRLFVKTALLLAFADGEVSAKESALVREFTAKLHLGEELGVLEGQVKDFLLSQLSHIKNTDAVIEIAKKLAI